MRDELQRQFPGKIVVKYHNIDEEAVRAEHAGPLKEIEERGLLYPVTAVDSTPVYDGAVSYVTVMRIVADKIAELQTTEG
jgi:disulfide oxidoreductase YuzD